jgi:hypothetical protein
MRTLANTSGKTNFFICAWPNNFNKIKVNGLSISYTNTLQTKMLSISRTSDP